MYTTLVDWLLFPLFIIEENKKQLLAQCNASIVYVATALHGKEGYGDKFWLAHTAYGSLHMFPPVSY